jgi:hypothetical protein
MEEFVPTVPYVSARLEYYKKLLTEAKALLAELKDPTEEGASARIDRQEFHTLTMPYQVMMELVYGLDEAMKALNVYSDQSFWKEVPEHTYAANDLGTRAKVALARIDPV